MNYTEVDFKFLPATDTNREIISALLSQMEFNSFTDTEQGIKAYIQEDLFNELDMNNVLSSTKSVFSEFDYSTSLIEDENWNANWERDFNPIEVTEDCFIRAPFHTSESKYKYELVIEPKMSFGTGHNSTTTLIMKLILDMDLHNKTVLDMGCGTGILAILSSLKGAKNILAIDIDEWAYKNTIENIGINNTKNILVKEGDVQLIKNERFDIILANINRNILLQDMDKYVQSLNSNGVLIMSGFYTQDFSDIKEKANQLNLKYEKHIEENNWVSVKLKNI